MDYINEDLEFNEIVKNIMENKEFTYKIDISLENGVEVKINPENEVIVKGPKGTLTKKLHKDMIIKVEQNDISDTNDLIRTVNESPRPLIIPLKML